ncbi:hypothetical protein GUJ93_ZPchr0007g5189 [Zizania palustris]|uniref:DUF7086 domain-containing protein n=1 Tax=Zizania palustris TaxID=103762 RepID=A0A8J5THV7_ZIZPA|nr:hypothetical protein GUJ93_ZPchr0007g5189 [Zizania palustris]
MEEKQGVRMIGWTREGRDDVDDPLALTLGSIYASVPTPPSSLPPPPGPHSSHQERSPRHRLNCPAAPLFAPAQHDTLEHLLLNGITSVEGVVRCKRCFGEQVIAYDLEAKFHEVRNYVAANWLAMNDRAPDKWMWPRLPNCVACGKEGGMSPVIPRDQREINWLFLFLGQMLGCCKLEDLKYFCMHTKRHRTGAKNRLVYSVFVEMCSQLEPQGPFHV